MNKKYNCGIYQILNLINGKCYVGQSINLNTRENDHFSFLRKNKHWNIHLQYAFNKYEEKNFIFKILIYCESFELTKYETFFDNFYKNLNLSYNIREIASSNKGMKFERSEEYKKNASIRQIGKKVSEITKQRIRNNMPNTSGSNNPFYGKKQSEETVRIIVEKSKNKFKVNGYPMQGKHHTEETKKKISIAQIGRKSSDESNQKRSKALKGKPWSQARRDAQNRKSKNKNE
jgi:group I intron endonuclease